MIIISFTLIINMIRKNYNDVFLVIIFRNIILKTSILIFIWLTLCFADSEFKGQYQSIYRFFGHPLKPAGDNYSVLRSHQPDTAYFPVRI